jgi:hypothetical protein
MERPITLEPGDSVSLALGTVANGTIWTWRVAVRDKPARRLDIRA